MPLPTQLSRRKSNVHKNDFGHVLIIAGSSRMLGAAALTSLAAMRAGAGLVTAAVAKSLNLTLHKKLSNTVMTWPLDETKDQSISYRALSKIKPKLNNYSAIAIGPGLSTHPNTCKFVESFITVCPIPMVIDADALNTLARDINILKKVKAPVILTPHPGEMARLTGSKKEYIENNRKKVAEDFSKKYQCTLLLKGAQTVIAQSGKRTAINRTGNSGMATAGSGDVLTGIIAALIAQGLKPYEATKYGAFIHGKAGDLAAKRLSRISITAEDIITHIPKAIQSFK